jgi:hypothetical protein
MAVLTANNHPIVRGVISVPRIGVPHADLYVDTQAALSSRVTIATADGSWELVGTTFREGVFTGTLSMRFVGGVGGLGVTPGGIGNYLPPKAYEGMTVLAILKDILRTCGENLSPTVTSSTTPQLNRIVKRWTRVYGTGKQALEALLEPLVEAWRVLPDGTFWCGAETWPDTATGAFTVTGRFYGEGRVEISSEQPFIMPGTIFTIPASTGVDSANARQRISGVVYSITSRNIFADVYFTR